MEDLFSPIQEPELVFLFQGVKKKKIRNTIFYISSNFSDTETLKKLHYFIQERK